MTTKADYTDEEWAALTRAPIVAGFAITLADPGGPIEITKEGLAAMKAAGAPPSDDELLVAVSQRHGAAAVAPNPVKDLDLKSKTARQQIVNELKRRERDPDREGHARGGRELPGLAGRGRAGGRQRGQGGRLLRDRRDAGQRGRGGDARPAPGDPRRRGEVADLGRPVSIPVRVPHV